MEFVATVVTGGRVIFSRNNAVSFIFCKFRGGRLLDGLGWDGLLKAPSVQIIRWCTKLIIPSKLEVAPPYAKCRSGLDGWMDTP